MDHIDDSREEEPHGGYIQVMDSSAVNSPSAAGHKVSVLIDQQQAKLLKTDMRSSAVIEHRQSKIID